MICFPSIVLIDDTKDDLDTIQTSLVNSGYPCFPILFQNNEPDNKSGIDHINLEMIHSRVIITDLNLQGHPQITATNLVGPIAGVLKKIAIDGPYLLYFWSRNADIVADVMKLIEQRYNDIPYPIHWGILDKTNFINNSDKLKIKIESLFTENSMFNAFFRWENRVSQAAQATTDSLFNLATPEDKTNISNFITNTVEKLQTMLAVIGNESIGQENAKDEPELSIELGLDPVLHDHLNSIWNKDNVWKVAIPKIGDDIKIDNELASRLNSFCHIECIQEDYSKACRGVFIEIDKNILNDDKKLKKLEKRFATTLKKLTEEEFIPKGLKDEKRKDLVTSQTRIGFIEISAECDQAQKKTKLHRYVLAALTPIKYSVDGKGDFDLFNKKEPSHGGIYRVPNININGIDYILQLSFKYQIGSIPSENIWLGKPLFRLRDQIMVDISFRCAQYISRPGIISFK